MFTVADDGVTPALHPQRPQVLHQAWRQWRAHNLEGGYSKFEVVLNFFKNSSNHKLVVYNRVAITQMIRPTNYKQS